MSAAVRYRPGLDALLKLTGTCFLVYEELQYLRRKREQEHPGESDLVGPSQRRIARKLRKSVRTIVRCFNRLRRAGLIVRFKRGNPRKGKYMTNLYRLVDCPGWSLTAFINSLAWKKKEAPSEPEKKSPPPSHEGSSIHVPNVAPKQRTISINSAQFEKTSNCAAEFERRASAPEPEKPEKTVRGGPGYLAMKEKLTGLLKKYGRYIKK